MVNMMNTYYTELKEKQGIDADFSNIESRNNQLAENKLEDVIKRLRPNCNARNFKEYLKFEEQQNKTLEWRKFTRDAHRGSVKDVS
mmetsp:Transcript_34190/g.52459  ORF Transcript_34190/g.52459 Transcript_34190/m.52459 type:complete len:86 (+) Transcript_34190:47-304(+)